MGRMPRGLAIFDFDCTLTKFHVWGRFRKAPLPAHAALPAALAGSVTATAIIAPPSPPPSVSRPLG